MTLNARALHNETSSVLDRVEGGQTFEIVRKGSVVARIQPAEKLRAATWEELMPEVFAAHKKVKRKTRNPVLAERARRRL